MKLCLHLLGFALLLGSVAGCIDGAPTVVEPSDPHPATSIQVSEDGVITATLDLPFAPGTGSSHFQNWSIWGRFPEHEELRIPAGLHEVEFEVSGGVSFVRKPGVEPWKTTILDGIYIGPGGVRLRPTDRHPVLRLQMGYEHAEFEGQGYPPLNKWQAAAYSTGPAQGRVVLFGPGRITFSRHYNSGWFSLWNYLGTFGETWQLWDWVSDQRVVLTIRPLTKMRLDCGSGTVTRGDSIGCHVSTEPSGSSTLTNIQWRFTDSAGVTVTAPSGTGDRWGGRMVIGGEISVTALLNGDSVGDTKRISVQARAWAGRIPYPSALPQERIVPTDFPVLPVAGVASDGYDQWIPGGLGRYEFDLQWAGKFQPINRGPNTGYWYLKDPPTWKAPVVYLSGHLEPGHPFYEAQTGRRPGDPNPPRGYTAGWCTRAHMDALRQEVREHEGSVPSGSRLSHHMFNVQYTSQNDPGPAVEVIILRPAPNDAFASLAEAALGAAYEHALEAANNATVHAAGNLYTLLCKVHLP